MEFVVGIKVACVESKRARKAMIINVIRRTNPLNAQAEGPAFLSFETAAGLLFFQREDESNNNVPLGNGTSYDHAPGGSGVFVVWAIV
jgi:hypothetical protein